MDDMEIDLINEVPDTPTRVATQSVNDKQCVKENNDGRLLFRPMRRPSSSHRPGDRSNTTSLKFEMPFSAEGVQSSIKLADENPGYRNSMHNQPKAKGKISSSPQSHAFRDASPVYLTKLSRHAHKMERATASGGTSKNSVEVLNKKPASGYELFSSHGGGYSSIDNKGKQINIASEVVPSSERDCSEIINLDQDIGGKSGPARLPSAAVKQKRLVRNGCISPHNIAKVSQSVGMYCSSAVDRQNNNSVLSTGTASSNDIMDIISEDTHPSTIKGKGVINDRQNNNSVLSTGTASSDDIRDIISEDNHPSTIKGKGVINDTFSSKEPTTRRMRTSSRKHSETSDELRNLEVLDGWRSTRNRSSEMYSPLKGIQYRSNQSEGGTLLRSESRRINNADGFRREHSSYLSSRQPIIRSRPHISRLNEHRNEENMLKRQKGSASTSHFECSSSAFDDSDIVLLGSSEGAPSSQATRSQIPNHSSILEPIIEIDEFSPEVRSDVSRGANGNCDDDVRARQLEADEVLAWELQQQLYNDVPSVETAEIDAHVALALQQEGLENAVIDRRHRLPNPRSSVLANLRRQSQLHPSTSASRRGTQSRASTSSRLTRMRSRFPGQPRFLSSSGGRNSLFPSNMDVETRMQILETLEAFNDLGVNGSFLQTQRDFNENDYEMLLALDENNHRVGASTNRINSLPQSTVQSENVEENCAICLETPTIGDVVRHLPCLHKFHKDCIDPWLARSTSCPVCKLSIT